MFENSKQATPATKEDGNDVEQEFVWVSRQWDDWRVAKYPLNSLANPHWDMVSGGIQAIALNAFIHGYVWCDGMVEGEVAHSCKHGKGPHQIKVCVTKKGNDPKVFAKLVETAGPNPNLGESIQWYQTTITYKGEVLWEGRSASEASARRRARKALGLWRLPPRCEFDFVPVEKKTKPGKAAG